MVLVVVVVVVVVEVVVVVVIVKDVAVVLCYIHHSRDLSRQPIEMWY